jgi:hypothetical protein
MLTRRTALDMLGYVCSPGLAHRELTAEQYFVQTKSSAEDRRESCNTFCGERRGSFCCFHYVRMVMFETVRHKLLDDDDQGLK